MKPSSSRYILTIIGTAIGVLVLLSFVPWNTATGNLFKNFDLFEDILPEKPVETSANTTTTVELDSELEKFYSEYNAGDTACDTSFVVSEELPVAPQCENDSANALEASEASAEVAEVYVSVPAQLVDSDGVAVIESYTGTGEVLPRFRGALGQSGSRTVRVAVVGDSFIESDILCQDLRDILQERYGGSGVGYMAMHSDIPGFRKSVRQSDNGWTMHDVRDMRNRDTLRVLSGDYAIGSSGARSKYSGVSLSPRTASWSRSALLFIAPHSGTISITTADGSTQSFDVEASGEPQRIEVNTPTTSVSVKSDIEGLVSFGMYLDADAGVQLDCMSIRGNSGIAHRKLNVALCRKLAKYVDYDLIILEFGINALSAEQTNYTPYMLAMTETINHLKKCYPYADILVLGISDRGTKSGTGIKSLPTCEAMVKAQREAARRTRTHFWDTRAAMGGENSVVEWRRRKLVNADYIHLNHDGGREMASLLSKSLFKALDE